LFGERGYVVMMICEVVVEVGVSLVLVMKCCGSKEWFYVDVMLFELILIDVN